MGFRKMQKSLLLRIMLVSIQTIRSGLSGDEAGHKTLNGFALISSRSASTCIYVSGIPIISTAIYQPPFLRIHSADWKPEKKSFIMFERHGYTSFNRDLIDCRGWLDQLGGRVNHIVFTYLLLRLFSNMCIRQSLPKVAILIKFISLVLSYLIAGYETSFRRLQRSRPKRQIYRRLLQRHCPGIFSHAAYLRQSTLHMQTQPIKRYPERSRPRDRNTGL